MKTMYLARANGTPLIVALTVVEETRATVREADFDGRPCLNVRRKVRAGEVVFDTWAEAYEWLLKWQTSRVTAARRALEIENGHLGNVKGMKPPKG